MQLRKQVKDVNIVQCKYLFIPNDRLLYPKQVVKSYIPYVLRAKKWTRYI